MKYTHCSVVAELLTVIQAYNYLPHEFSCAIVTKYDMLKKL